MPSETQSLVLVQLIQNLERFIFERDLIEDLRPLVGEVKENYCIKS